MSKKFGRSLVLICIMVCLAGCDAGLTRRVARRSRTRRVAEVSSARQGFGGLKINGYGLGVHQNRYGQAIRLIPDGGSVGGMLRIKENAYGPGIHSDQYGRVVRERPF